MHLKADKKEVLYELLFINYSLYICHSDNSQSVTIDKFPELQGSMFSSITKHFSNSTRLPI